MTIATTVLLGLSLVLVGCQKTAASAAQTVAPAAQTVAPAAQPVAPAAQTVAPAAQTVAPTPPPRAQETSPKMTQSSQALPPSAAEARFVDWQSYESPEHGYVTKFPATPTSTTVSAAQQLTWSAWDGAAFAVLVFEGGDKASVETALHDATAALLNELFDVEAGTIPVSEISAFKRTETEVLVDGHAVVEIELRGTAMGLNYAVHSRTTHSRTTQGGENTLLQISLTEEQFRPFFAPLTW